MEKMRAVSGPDLAAAFGGWWRESGMKIERALELSTSSFEPSFHSHVTRPAQPGDQVQALMALLHALHAYM